MHPQLFFFCATPVYDWFLYIEYIAKAKRENSEESTNNMKALEWGRKYGVLKKK